MAEALQPLQILTIPFPGTYEVHALKGGPVAVFTDGEAVENLSKKAAKARGGQVDTFTTEGRLHVLATDHALVEVTDVDQAKISAQKAASSAQAQPEPANKAAGKTAADPAQPPSPPKAQKAKPSSAKTKGAKTNKPTTSQIEAKATGTDPARRLSTKRK